MQRFFAIFGNIPCHAPPPPRPAPGALEPPAPPRPLPLVAAEIQNYSSINEKKTHKNQNNNKKGLQLNLLCARSSADLPLPAVPAFGPAFLNIGAFFSMSGSIKKRIFEPRI